MALGKLPYLKGNKFWSKNVIIYFSMSLSKTTSNNNPDSEECRLDRATELNISNNNLIHCPSDDRVFEKRDHSTEKLRPVVNDNQGDIEESNLSIADSLENLENENKGPEDDEEEDEEEVSNKMALVNWK